MKFVHGKFDAYRLSKKKVIEKIRWTIFVDFDYHLGLSSKMGWKSTTLFISNIKRLDQALFGRLDAISIGFQLNLNETGYFGVFSAEN